MADSKKIVIVGAGIVVLAAAGWFGWQQFAVEDEPPPAAAARNASPPRSAAPKPVVNRDALITEVLDVSGYTAQIASLPAQLLAGFSDSLGQKGKRTPSPQAVQSLINETFTAEKFQQRVAQQLKTNYDPARLEALQADLGRPVIKRVVELEKAPVDRDQLASFAGALRTNPLPAERQALLTRLNDATRAADLLSEMTLTAVKASLIGAMGPGADTSVAERTIENQRASITEPIHTATLANFGYTYRRASDADLEQYIKLYESEHGRWLVEQVYAGLLDEFRAGAEELGTRLAELKPAGKAGDMAARPAVSSRRHEDARSCLQKEDNMNVIRCAEAYL